MSDREQILRKAVSRSFVGRIIDNIGDIGFLAAGFGLCLAWWRWSLSGAVPPEMVPLMLLGGSVIFCLLFICKLMLLISSQLSLISEQQYFSNALINPKTRKLAVKVWDETAGDND